MCYIPPPPDRRGRALGLLLAFVVAIGMWALVAWLTGAWELFFGPV